MKLIFLSLILTYPPTAFQQRTKDNALPRFHQCRLRRSNLDHWSCLLWGGLELLEERSHCGWEEAVRRFNWCVRSFLSQHNFRADTRTGPERSQPTRIWLDHPPNPGRRFSQWRPSLFLLNSFSKLLLNKKKKKINKKGKQNIFLFKNSFLESIEEPYPFLYFFSKKSFIVVHIQLHFHHLHHLVTVDQT